MFLNIPLLNRDRVKPTFPLVPSRLSLLATLVAGVSSPNAFAETQTDVNTSNPTLIVTAAEQPVSENTPSDYSVPVTRAGNKLLSTVRDIPQSVSIISVQRMKDQQLQSLNDVLDNTTAIQTSTADMDRKTYYSRGFLIDNYLIDGIPTVFEERWNLGDAQTDSALYERIEVVRGANGLLTGAGNPSAAVNMVRKHANRHQPEGEISASYGSWNKQRYVMDVQSPLNAAGNVRGRVIAGYQDNNSFIERYGAEKKFVYGVIDADLNDATTLSAGYEFQQLNTDNPMWGGLPRWYTDGSKTHFRRGFNTAPDWTYNDKESRKLFARLKHTFTSGWQWTLNGTHDRSTLNSKMMYIAGYFDKNTGAGVSPYADYPVVAGTGYNTAKRQVDAVDTFASGPYQLFGRTHELMVGVSYSKQKNTYYGTFANISPQELGNFNLFDGQFPETDWAARTLSQQDITRQTSGYLATRISLADPLNLILGARYTRWSKNTLTNDMEKNNITPYAGLIYDIDENWSTYASYTSVFQPQSYRDLSGAYLAPVIGKNYEAGVKSDWFDSRLTTSLSIFRAELDNVAQTTGRIIPGTTESAYEGKNGTVSRGIEFEINGAITDNWQMTLGGTRYIAEQRDGTAVKPDLPRTQFNLFTRYRLPLLPDLTVGGGVKWQTHVWSDNSAPEGNGTWRAEQGSYALVNLFSRYQVTKNFAVQGNINNLFDKTYDTNVAGDIVYGEPRNVSVTASYRF